MSKKIICFVLAICMALVCLPGVYAEEELKNDIIYHKDFNDGYVFPWSYSDPAPGQSPTNCPWFQNIEGQLVYDTDTYAGQVYPIKGAGRPSYARTDMTEKIQDANQYQYLYQVDLKFERAFFAFEYTLRYGAVNWDNNKTKDVRLFDTTAAGLLRFGEYSQQLELGVKYTVSVLVDVRGETRHRTLYINGELISENQATDIGANPDTQAEAKTIFKQSMIVRPYQGSGSDYTYLDTKLTVDNQKLIRVRNMESMMVEGDTKFVIPKNGELTSQFKANTIFEDNVSADWRIEPQGNGISIDTNGLLTILPEAEPGDYQVIAEQGSKSAGLAVTLEALKLEMMGESRILLPKGGTYSQVRYNVKDNVGAVYPAEYTMEPQQDGIYLSQDGTLRIYGPEASGLKPVTLTALVDGETVTKTVTFAGGYFEDFSKTNNWGTVQVEEEPDGNRYLHSEGTRCDSPVISDSADLDVITMEYRYKVGATARNVVLGGTSDYKPDGSIDSGKWWLQFNAAQKDSGASVSLTSNGKAVYSGTVPLTNEAGWLQVKYVISCFDETIDLYLDGNKVCTEASLDQKLFDYRLRQIINYAPIDDIKIYSGEGFGPEQVGIEILTSGNQPKAGAGGQTTALLKAKVMDDGGEELAGHSVTWSLDSGVEGVEILGSKLVINETAPDTFMLGAQITTAPDTLVKKEIHMIVPDVYIAQKDGVLTFTGEPNASFIVTIFKPKDTSNIVSSFLAAFDKEDADDETTYFQQTLQADGSGKATLDLGSQVPGLYKAFAKSSEDGVESSMEVSNRMQELFTTNAIENLADPQFKTLLQNYTNQPEETVEAAWNTFQGLRHKETAALLCAEDIGDFYLACALMDAVGGSAYDKVKTEALVAAYPDYDFAGAQLLAKNIDFEAVVNAAAAKKAENPSQFLADIKEQSILIGMKKLPNINDAKTFLAALGNAKYNGATASQKTYIAQQIGNKTYDSLDAVNAAVNALTLPTDGGGSSGPSGGGSGGGRRPGGSSDRPVSSGTIDTNPLPDGGNHQTERFSDVGKGHWAYQYIETLAQKNVLTGDGGKFRPEDHLTRAEFVKTLMVAFQMQLGEQADFEDVSPDDWFAPYVAGAQQAQLINGAGNQFLPDAAISRQDAVVMAYRFAVAAGRSWQAAEADFADGAQIADYAKEAVAVFAANGIVEGVGGGLFAPEESVTRAAAAKIVCQLIEGGRAN